MHWLVWFLSFVPWVVCDIMPFPCNFNVVLEAIGNQSIEICNQLIIKHFVRSTLFAKTKLIGVMGWSAVCDCGISWSYSLSEYLEIFTFENSIKRMDHPKFFALNQMEESVSA